MFSRIAFFAVFAAAPLAAQAADTPAADTSHVYSVAEVDILPAPDNVSDLRVALNALYPPHLRASGTPGRVMVELVVGRDGRPRDVKVVSTTDSAFSQPTVTALGVLRFRPAHRGTGPVAVRVSFPVNWTVAGSPAAAAPQTASAPAPAEPAEPAGVSFPPELRNGAEVLGRMRSLYPRDLRRTRVRGTVWVRIQVTPAGTAENVSIVRSTDPAFEAPTLQLVAAMRFRPATVDGRPIAAWVDMPLEWTY